MKDYLRTLPRRSSFIQLACFYSNFLEYYVPRRTVDGSLNFAVYLPPDAPVPFVDPLTATGPAVLSLFDDPDSYAGQTLPVIGQVLTARQIVDTFVRVTGQRAHYASAYAREELLKHFPALGCRRLAGARARGEGHLRGLLRVLRAGAKLGMEPTERSDRIDLRRLSHA